MQHRPTVRYQATTIGGVSPVRRVVALVGASATAALGLVVMPGVASAAAPAVAQTIVITPPSGLLNTAETRATGHNDFLEDGLHVWTEGATYTDKAAGYIAHDQSLLSLAAAPEPVQVWTPSQDLPAFPAPGEQIVIDFDHNGSVDGTLVGEPTYYGNNWWLTGGSQQFVKDAAPHQGGGSGSQWYGTLAEWALKFSSAETAAVGYSLGSGVHGDGVLSSMTYGETTYRFALGVGPCEALIDAAAQTYTLSQDCTTLETINVGDGWTVDGNGHMLTAVEDTQHPNFPGAIIVSATGSAGAPASLHVANLNIDTDFTGANSGGQLAGIKFVRAGGSVTNTVINGVTHGNGVQEGIALYVRNRGDDGSSNVPEATIAIDHVTVTRYQKSGVILDGNVAFSVTNSTVGRSTDQAGNPLDALGANSVQISRGAHGAVTDSTIGLNDYNPTPPPGDGSDATAVLIYDSGAVTMARNIVAGTNGDVGVDAYNDGTGAFDTALTASCNLFQRNEVPGDYDPYGIGIAQWDDGSVAVPINLSDTTFTGWKYATGLVSGSVPSLNVQPGATDQKLGQCLPSAPAVTVTGGDTTVDVTWTASTAPAYAPLLGYDVTLTGDDSSTSTQHVAAGTTVAHFTGLAEGVTYTATVAAVNASGSAAGSATVYGTSITLTPADGTITYMKATQLIGALTSADPNANLAGRSLVVEARPVGDANWTVVAHPVTDADGAFVVNVKPKLNTVYRAHYAGNPDMASTSNSASVYVAPKVTIKVSDSTVTHGTTVQFSGHVTPNLKHHPVQLEHLVGGVWTTVMTDDLTAHSRYSFFWEADDLGSSTWRVTVPSSAKLATAHSKKKVVVVS